MSGRLPHGVIFSLQVVVGLQDPDEFVLGGVSQIKSPVVWQSEFDIPEQFPVNVW
jgi:hypothetical protein